MLLAENNYSRGYVFEGTVESREWDPSKPFDNDVRHRYV